MIDEAVSRFGGLDIMFTNAGIGGAEGSNIDCPDEVWDRVVDGGMSIDARRGIGQPGVAQT